MIYIPVLEINSKHCDPNSLTSFNYLKNAAGSGFEGDQNVTLLLTLAALASPELCGSWTAWAVHGGVRTEGAEIYAGEHVHSRWCCARLGCAVLFKDMQMISNDSSAEVGGFQSWNPRLFNAIVQYHIV